MAQAVRFLLGHEPRELRGLDPNLTEGKQIWWGRIYSLVIGLAATGAAGVVSSLGTLFELSQIILGVFAGPLLSCIVAAVAGWRCSGRVMILAMLIGWAAGVTVTWSGASALWVAPVSAAMTLMVARLFRRSGAAPAHAASAARGVNGSVPATK